MEEIKRAQKGERKICPEKVKNGGKGSRNRKRNGRRKVKKENSHRKVKSILKEGKGKGLEKKDDMGLTKVKKENNKGN